MNKHYMAAVLVLLISNNASAALLYSDRNEFYQGTETYIVDGYDSETYGWDSSDTYGSVRLTDSQLNSLSPEVTYSTDHNINWVGFAYTYQNDPGVFCSGCNLAFTMGFTDTSIGTFSGVYAMGFDIVMNSASDTYPNETRHAYVTFGDGSIIDYTLPKHGFDLPSIFWGIASDQLISSITFDDPATNLAQTSLIIDNLTIGTSPVPIPAAIWLFGSGLFGLLGFARYKKR